MRHLALPRRPPPQPSRRKRGEEATAWVREIAGAGAEPRLITAVIDGDDLRDRRRLPTVSDADPELVVAKFARQPRRPSPP